LLQQFCATNVLIKISITKFLIKKLKQSGAQHFK
jgi:hypothetical protein